MRIARIFFNFVLLAVLAPAAFGQTGKPVWSDEFEGAAGSAPDSSKWVLLKGGEGWGNKELQYYTESRDNARLDGKGNLVIEARKTDPNSGLECWYGRCLYTSARLTTRDLFARKYGRFEARMKLPDGQGVWPAFWMLGDDIGTVGWPVSGEIDIMEMIGKQPSTLFGTIHGPGYSGGNGIGSSVNLPSGKKFSDGFNVFAVEWGPRSIKWFLNGKQYQERTPADIPENAKWAFDHPHFLLLNLAIGGEWPGSPDDATKFPAIVEVDYVRVYDQ